MTIEIPAHIEKIIDRLESAGHEAYIVGGSLRDIILGREPNDFDVTTSAEPAQTLELFSDMRTIPTGLHHGTLTILSEGEPVEVTTFREDGEYLDSRHPESVSFTKSITEDLARRDFTVNAIAYNKKRGIVDPFDGSEDIKKGILRAVGDAEKRFSEDALRIMRALRFSAQLGFSIEEDTKKALVTKSDGLAKISRERIGVEVQKLVTAKYPKEPLEFMFESGISRHVFGEYVPSEKLLDALTKLSGNDWGGYSELIYPGVCFAALLWDCDKDYASKILNGLKYSNAFKHGVLKLINVKNIPLPQTDAEMRRFILAYLDFATAIKLREAICGPSSLTVKEALRVKKTFPFFSIGDLAVDGKDLIALGIVGKDIGKTLEALFDAIIEDPSKNSKEMLIKLAKKLNNK